MRKLLWICLVAIGFAASAKDIPAQAVPPRLVNDYAGVLGRDEAAQLEKKLDAYADSTSTQIAVVIEQSLEGDDLFSYTQKLAQGWGIGEKGKSNGLLIYIALKEHAINIHTGYGMEGSVPDLLAKQIIDDNIRPAFKQGDYYEGLDEATGLIMKAASGEYVNEHRGSSKKKGGGLLQIIVIAIIIIVFLFRAGGGGGGRRRRGFWMGPAFYGGTFGSGGFSSGGGSGGGGGFGGFGGGSFGGGGASGSW